MVVPNKTIYVSDGDLPLFEQAQKLAGGNLSAAIAKALKRYVDTAEGLSEGYEEITVRVGVGLGRRGGRKVRFTAVLVGEYMDTIDKRFEHYRVWRGRGGKYVLHVERVAADWMVDEEGNPAGWRGYLGIGNIRYGGAPGESTLEVFTSLDELKDKVPPELFDMVTRSARQPAAIEDLDL